MLEYTHKTFMQGIKNMHYETFEALLSSVGLSKKEFAGLVKMNYTSVTNWKQSDSVPEWVDSWIQNYKFKNFYDVVKTEFDKQKDI